MLLYTCILTYDGKTHVSQVRAATPEEVPARWAEVYEARPIPHLDPDDRHTFARVMPLAPEMRYQDMPQVWSRVLMRHGKPAQLTFVQTHE